jgi:hypothetical protein
MKGVYPPSTRKKSTDDLMYVFYDYSSLCEVIIL